MSVETDNDDVAQLKDQVRKLWINVIDADRSSALWMGMDNLFKDEKGAKTYNRYAALFNTVRRTSFVNSVISIARFCDKPNSAAGFEQILKDVKKIGTCFGIAPGLESEFAAEASGWEKIRKLRNNCFAHSAKQYTERELLAEVALTENEFYKLVSCARKLVFRIGTECLDTHFEMNSDKARVRSDYEHLIADLERCLP